MRLPILFGIFTSTFAALVLSTLLSLLALAISLKPSSAVSESDELPQVLHIGPVKPDIIGITVQAGRIEYGRQVPYERQPNDRIEEHGKERLVFRDGKFLGWLVGKDGKLIYTEDRLIGAPLATKRIDNPKSYSIVSPNDPDYSVAQNPVEVHRKSKPSDFGRWNGWPFLAPVRHVVYLRLPKPLKIGCRYRIQFAENFLPEQEFIYDPQKMRSEAVHVSHIGFHPDDPVKVAFLSLWMGTGGPVEYPEGLKFHVLDDRTGKPVFSGTVRLIHRPGEPEDAYNKDYAGTFVYEMDFSPLRRLGRYRVYVEGVGCSYPFQIAENVWQRAFYVAARGFYHQRSGIELGPPYTTFRRPRPFHPDDGVVVYQSTCPLMYSGNGLNALGTDKDNFGNLVKGKTNEIVPNAWGGYMDAGDWDRRIQHLIVTRYLLDLAELFPKHFERLSLNIPESGNNLPDIIDEALWNLDFYQRLQTPEGGVRGGIESSEHPRHGECSWQESLTVMAYAPDPWCSYIYAGVAAKAALVFKMRGDSKRANLYQESALRAMVWAEKERERMEKTGEFKNWRNDALIAFRDERNLAAADLYRLTGDERWHKIFLETTAFIDPKAELYEWQKHEQREAAWVYVQTNLPGVNKTVQENCRQAILREAEERLKNTERTSFRYAKYSWMPGGWGAFTKPDAVSLVRAYLLTGDTKYLRGAILACQYGLGANPVNICFTTGLGHDFPRHPLHIDSRLTHQPPPEGLTVFGPFDVQMHKGHWAQEIVNRYCHPEVQKWPTLEAYWDVFWYPEICEFTVQHPMATVAYVWGFLSAVKR